MSQKASGAEKVAVRGSDTNVGSWLSGFYVFAPLLSVLASSLIIEHSAAAPHNHRHVITNGHTAWLSCWNRQSHRCKGKHIHKHIGIKKKKKKVTSRPEHRDARASHAMYDNSSMTLFRAFCCVLFTLADKSHSIKTNQWSTAYTRPASAEFLIRGKYRSTADQRVCFSVCRFQMEKVSKRGNNSLRFLMREVVRR